MPPRSSVVFSVPFAEPPRLACVLAVLLVGVHIGVGIAYMTGLLVIVSPIHSGRVSERRHAFQEPRCNLSVYLTLQTAYTALHTRYGTIACLLLGRDSRLILTTHRHCLCLRCCGSRYGRVSGGLSVFGKQPQGFQLFLCRLAVACLETDIADNLCLVTGDDTGRVALEINNQVPSCVLYLLRGYSSALNSRITIGARENACCNTIVCKLRRQHAHKQVCLVIGTAVLVIAPQLIAGGIAVISHHGIEVVRRVGIQRLPVVVGSEQRRSGR